MLITVIRRDNLLSENLEVGVGKMKNYYWIVSQCTQSCLFLATYYGMIYLHDLKIAFCTNTKPRFVIQLILDSKFLFYHNIGALRNHWYFPHLFFLFPIYTHTQPWFLKWWNSCTHTLEVPIQIVAQKHRQAHAYKI